MAFFGHDREQEGKEEEHAEDAEGTEEFVIGDAGAEDGPLVAVTEKAFVEGVEHAQRQSRGANTKRSEHGH